MFVESPAGPVAVPVATQRDMGSGAIDSAGIYFVDCATAAVESLERLVVAYYMFAAADSVAADTGLSTAGSAAAGLSTTQVGARSDTAENCAAERSADIPAVVAAAYSDT